MRVAIVGCGPKGTYALERLVGWSNGSAISGIELTVYEPNPFPGAGPAYDPRSGEHLLMNYPAAKIDLAHPRPPRGYAGPSFVEWSGRRPDSYAPRAEVGGYLHEGLLGLLDDAPFAVHLHPAGVRGLRRSSEGWIIAAGPEGDQEKDFDEVLLAVGHRSTPSPPLSGVAAGCKVSLRGFGLTAVDLVLELTEGRGGRFAGQPWSGLTYLESNAEPMRIRPWSRSGRPMLVKPDLPVAQSTLMSEKVGAARARLLTLRDPLDLAGLIEIEVALAVELLVGCGAPAEIDRIGSWFERASRGGLPSCADPLGLIRHSLEVAVGGSSPGIEWAIGAAWRESYPAIVSRLSHGGLRAGDRLAFRTLAAELERLAFGPPALNAAKLIALAETGILDLSAPTRAASPDEICLDARIAPPGLHPDQDPTGSLVSAGAVCVPPGLRGIEIDREGRCIGEDGSPTSGLSATGRLTEDWVIGNDSLSRSLHPELDRWARRICLAAPGGGREAHPDLSAAGARR